MVERVNASAAGKLAVDTPSGLDGASGALAGPAVRADETVTFFRFKPGHVLLPGRLACGRLHLADIGVVPKVLETIGPKTFLNRRELWLSHFPRPEISGHKYDRGHLVAVCGPKWQTGAARLAARAGLRAGAGLVTLACSDDALAVVGPQSLAVMTRRCEGPLDLARILSDRRKNACVIGPGLGVGEGTRALVEAALAAAPAGTERPLGLALDADALTVFARDWRTLRQRIGASGAHVAITPHDGEFDRVFNILDGKFCMNDEMLRLIPEQAALNLRKNLVMSGQHVEFTDKLSKARVAAALLGAVVVHKGADTVVAAPDGRAAIADNAPPWLATAGAATC